MKTEPAKPARTAILEKGKTSKRYLLPVISRQIINCQLQGARKMLQIYIKNNSRRVNGNIEIINDNSEDQQSLKEREEEVAEDNDTLSKALSAENAGTNTKDEDKSTEEKETSTEESNTSTSTENNSTSAEDKDDFLENIEYGTDFIKIFGSTNDVNEILDVESEYNLLNFI